MIDERWTAVDRYVTDLLLPADPILDAALADSTAAGLPAISVSAPQGQLLWMLARLGGARRILEIGTLGGYSTIWLARGMTAGGRLVSLEMNPAHARVARKNIARAGLSDAVEIRVGAALETLPTVEADGRGPFDLIFIDADKTGYPDYLDWALRLSRPGTLIVADNVVRDGQVADPASTDPNVRAVRAFHAKLAADARVTATVIQTVGNKGYDGLALAIVKG